MGKNSQNQCPHCHSKAAIRTSKKMSDLTREIYFQCTDVECGFTWASHLSAIRTIHPSGKPNPRVFIPMNPSTAKKLAINPSG